jgi:hypothetical protein
MGIFNPSTDIATYIQTIYADAMLVARENNLMVNLVTVANDRQGLASRSSSEYGSATISDVNQEDDLISQAFAPSVLATLTPTEKGAQFSLPDVRIESDPFSLRQDASQELGAALAAKIDTDIAGVFSSLTGGTVGAAGTTLTWGHFFAMASRLKAQHAPLPYVFVCHPYQWHALGKAVAPGATVTNGAALQDAVLRNFYVSSVAGIDVFVTANTTLSGTDGYAAMFSRPAIMYDNRRSPRLEPERDASRRCWELNLTSVYAKGVWRPKWGIQGLFDCSAPTS